MEFTEFLQELVQLAHDRNRFTVAEIVRQLERNLDVAVSTLTDENGDVTFIVERAF